MPVTRSFGEELKRIRTENGWSQRDVAARSGSLSASAVKRVESDERDPYLSTLEALAVGLNITITIGPKGIVIREE